MSAVPIDTPILLLWFNRPQLARQVLDRLRPLRPATIFVSIDGPRAGYETDAQNIADSITLLTSIDWPCSLHTRILTENQGCRRAVSSAIDWFFSRVNEGIILEDDCLPDPTFFTYCTELLARYRYDERVMHISGANLSKGHVWENASYFFSRIPHVWGWASWRRAWQLYDVTMATYPTFEQQNGIPRIISDKESARYWQRILRTTHDGRVDTWDYQWTYAVWEHDGLCITPNQNLVTNIGFGPAATHTTKPSSFANLPTVPLVTMDHPARIEENKDAMYYVSKHLYCFPSRLAVSMARVKQFLTAEL